MTAYPRIDIQAGGSADTVLEGLNRLIELTVPNRKAEAGTLIWLDSVKKADRCLPHGCESLS